MLSNIPQVQSVSDSGQGFSTFLQHIQCYWCIQVLTDFLSTDEIADMPLNKLVDFVCDKGKNRFSDPEKTAELLQKAARDSYRLDKCLYGANFYVIALSSSFNVVKAYTKELKTINSAIEVTLKVLILVPTLFSSPFLALDRSTLLVLLQN